jgi:hypothetical protein
MGEMNIEKVPADKFVAPADGYRLGYYGYCPDDSDADSDTVAVQAPLAEEQYKGKGTPKAPARHSSRIDKGEAK